MQFLLDLPLVIRFAEWVWSEDNVVTPQSCLNTVPFMPGGCWTGLIVKGVGVAIILGACTNKLPVIFNMMASTSAAGIAATAVYGETVVYANGAAYGWLNRHPITAWGENFGLLVQSIVTVVLMWRYNAPSTGEQGLVMLSMLIYCATAFSMPQSSYYLLMTRAQSIVTVTLNLLGGLARIGTTIKEVGFDFGFLATFVLSCALNFILFVQYFYYKENTARFLADLKATADKKSS